MSYDGYDDLEPSNSRGRFRPGSHIVEIVEVSDRTSKNPKNRGATVFAVQTRVIESAPSPGHAAHYQGEQCGIVTMHGPGSPGYDPNTKISYGDKDIKAYLIAMVASTSTDPGAVKSWGKIAEGVVHSVAQTARGIRVRVRAWEELRLDKDTKLPVVKNGAQIMDVRTVLEPVAGQTAFASVLLAGAPPDTKAQTTTTAPPSPPRPGAPARPGAVQPHEHSNAVRAELQAWADAGSSRAEADAALEPWASGLGLSAAQYAAAAASVFGA